MTTEEIEAFLAICRTGSVSKAAETLFVSQSSLSIRLKNLENELGTALLLRGRGIRDIRLTETGELFFPLAQEYMDVLAGMKQLSCRTLTRLRVSTFSSLGTCLLPDVLEIFSRRYPDVDLVTQDMEGSAARSGVQQGLVDAAFSTREITARGFRSTPCFTEPLVLLTGPDSVFAKAKYTKLLDPDKEVYTDWCAEYEDWHAVVFGGGRLSRISISQIEPLKRFLKRKDYWAAMPVTVASVINRDGEFTVIPLQEELPSRTIWFVRGLSREKDVLTENLIGCVREVAARHPEITLAPEQIGDDE